MMMDPCLTILRARMTKHVVLCVDQRLVLVGGGQYSLGLALLLCNAASQPACAAGQRGSADALFWFAAKDYSRRAGTPAFGLATFNLELRPSFETFRSFVETIR